jgi:predicted lactoylglutathione lyase
MDFQASHIFVNIAVRDLQAAKAFFAQVGFHFEPQFTNDDAACMVLGPNLYAMLLTHEHFRQFTKKDIADATQVTEVLIALSAASRAEVDAVVDAALAAGATSYAEPVDYGFMYHRVFADLDGHQWEIVWMDPAHLQSQQ